MAALVPANSNTVRHARTSRALSERLCSLNALTVRAPFVVVGAGPTGEQRLKRWYDALAGALYNDNTHLQLLVAYCIDRLYLQK
jgi:hypothetical protein